MALKRRDLLVSGAVLLAVFGIPPTIRRYFPRFEFKPLNGFDGFRQLDKGPVSTGPIAFLGLETSDEDLSADRARILQSPCQSIFGSDGWEGGLLPIAMFTDYNCPYCSVLSERLIQLEESGAPIKMIWHELPLLGPASERAASAALAAAQQGQYIAAHRHLMRRVFPPGPVGLRLMAKSLDLDPDRLIADAGGAKVAAELRQVRALASAVGVIGTPTTFVGRTMVAGAISASDLNNLIDIERSESATACG